MRTVTARFQFVPVLGFDLEPFCFYAETGQYYAEADPSTRYA